jgi:cellulose synthase/poly-beta-1,6-N-acetylglucosamine synthase-like glycosyltransferase
VILLLPTVSDVVSLARLPFVRRPRRASPTRLPGLLFLVPAHNEEVLLGSCLQALARQTYPTDRMDIVVIADNSSDRTAEVARAAGVRCREREDPDHPGKPHAIAWALEREDVSTYDAVVIVDADTEVDSGFAAALAASGPLRDRVVQPFNDVRNRADNAVTRMGAVWSMASHGLSFRLKGSVGLNVPLSVGMCLGADVLRRYGWQAFSVCEDWEMYAALTLRGVRIDPAPQAHSYAQQARSLAQSAPQRRRWTAGKLEVLARYGPRFLSTHRVSGAQRLDALAELSALGPAVHLGVAGLGAVAAGLTGPPAGPWVAAAFLLSLLRSVVYAGLAVTRDREPWRAVAAFLYLPVYTAWRLGVAVTALTRASRQMWVRTPRHPPEPADGNPGRAVGVRASPK